MTRLTNLLDSGISLDLCLLMESTWVRVKMDNMLSSNGIKTLTTEEPTHQIWVRSSCALNPNFQKIQPGSKKTHSLITNSNPITLEHNFDQSFSWTNVGSSQRRGLNGEVSAGVIRVFSVGQCRFWGLLIEGFSFGGHFVTQLKVCFISDLVKGGKGNSGF